MPAISPADTAWMLIATAMVLLMTVALGFVGIAWALIGYSLAFSEGSRLVGDLRFAFLHNVGLEAKGTIPHILFASYQGTFAVITAALISGAIVERMRFGPYLTFVALWCIGVYAPIAHWVWGGGWLGKLGALDFAGGTVVHINAAVAALVLAVVLGARQDYSGARIWQHDVRADGDARRMEPARFDAHAQNDRDWSGDGNSCRPRCNHARCRIHQPTVRDCTRWNRRSCQLLLAFV